MLCFCVVETDDRSVTIQNTLGSDGYNDAVQWDFVRLGKVTEDRSVTVSFSISFRFDRIFEVLNSRFCALFLCG